MIDELQIINLIELRKYDQALTILSKALSENPENPPLYYLGSICHTAEGDIEKAKVWISQAINLDPDENEYKLQLATVYLENNELKDCSNVLYEISPKDEEEQEKKLETEMFLNLQTEDFSFAQKLSQQILKLNPQNSNAYGVIGFTQLFLGSKDDSLRYVLKAIEIDPENQFARYVHILNKIVRNEKTPSELTIMDYLSEDASSFAYLEGLKFVLLAKNPFSKAILWFRFLVARHIEKIRVVYRILFRILLIGACFFYIHDSFLFGYSTALLLAYSISSFPLKTIPLLQNLFLLPSRFRDLLISKSEMVCSIGAVALCIFGFSIIYVNPIERNISIGLTAIYMSGLPFDYFYGIQSGYGRRFMIFAAVALISFLGLIVSDNDWAVLFYFMLIGFLISYTFWKRTSSVTAI